MPALPQGAADTAIRDLRVTCPGRNFFKCATTPIGRHPVRRLRAECKSLVKIHMADICAYVAGAGEPDHGIEVCAIQVNLTAMFMHDLQMSLIVSSNTPWLMGM